MPTKTKDVVFSQIGYIGNKVDRLYRQIKEIQAKCHPHDFRLLEEPQLIESLVSKVFFCIQRTLPEVRCLECSIRKLIDFRKTCPKCLGVMVPGELEMCQKYRNAPYDLIYSARLYTCEACKFRSVFDEMDE